MRRVAHFLAHAFPRFVMQQAGHLCWECRVCGVGRPLYVGSDEPEATRRVLALPAI
jgi:hypothetical protein